MAICLSAGGGAAYSAASSTTQILIGTVNGVVVLERDPAGRWSEAQILLEGKHIHALLVEPRSGALFAGVRDGGIYVSVDGGENWQRRDEGVTANNIYSLCVSAGKETRIYAGTEPAHLFVTENLGESWTELPALRSVESVPDWTFPGPPYVAHVKHLASDYSDPNKIYACVEQGCLLKSTDAGQSWVELYGVDEDAHRIAIHPTQPDVLYLSTGNGLYRSENQGERWKHITPRTLRIGYPDPLLLHPTIDGLMFIAGALHGPEVWRSTKTANSAIGRSRDGGRTWEFLRNGLPEPIHGNIGAMAMEAFDGGFNLFACGTDGNVFFSGDGGDQWTTIASGIAPLSKGNHFVNLRPRLEPAAS